jgi:lipoprotein-anchoring transpeptidase ErfK/SrfK
MRTSITAKIATVLFGLLAAAMPATAKESFLLERIESSINNGVPGYMRAKFKRQEVKYSTSEKPGTIVIETRRRYLYLVLGDGKALRYGIGVGRVGFTWKGEERITRKAEWPSWTPPKEMREREPDLPAFMPGGPDNPLGARALYLGGTEYRIHGTIYPQTIGHAVSSGCFRLTNDDVIDLYQRAKVGAKVIIR